MSTALTTNEARLPTTVSSGGGLVPWRDPHTVPRADLSAYIQKLERACIAQPRSSDLRTCLGMAYAMKFDVDKSMAALEEAVALAPTSFWARMKYAELHYRLRMLNEAERHTVSALNVAGDSW